MLAIWIFSFFCVFVCMTTSTEAANVRPKIYNGEDTKRNEFPWMGYIAIEGNVVCGAVLVDPLWALCDAYCALGGPQNVTFGDFDLTRSTDGEILVEVQRIELHPKFKPGREGYNIALIRLKNPGYRSYLDQRNIGIIQDFADKPIERRIIKQGIKCTAMGYGLDKDPKTGYWVYSTNLKKINVKYITNKECVATGIPPAIDEICQGAVTGVGGSCYIDEGSPTVCEYKGKQYLVGILSYVNNLDGCVGGYRHETSIATHRQWILDTINK